jgi:hypothetical protein
VVLVHSFDLIYVWVNPEAPPTIIWAFFGSDTLPREVPQLDTRENVRLNEVITECYAMSGRYLPVEVIPPGDPREAIFGDILVDVSVASGGDLASFITGFCH